MGNSVAQNAKRRIELRRFVSSLKTRPCVDCGKSYDPCCMDFDHVGEKMSDISSMVRNLYSRESILREIEKTELVCVICHRKRTRARAERDASSLSQHKSAVKTRNRIEELRKIVYSSKEKLCAVCGEEHPPWLMDLDHISGDKVANLSKMIGKNASKTDILSEIEKCRVLCALCHRLKSSNDQILAASNG
jgi:hypothetical protein